MYDFLQYLICGILNKKMIISNKKQQDCDYKKKKQLCLRYETIKYTNYHAVVCEFCIFTNQ